jgi:hypothetical protein
MKSLIFTLCTIIGFQVAYAQVPLSATLPAINKTFPVTQNMLRHGQAGQAGGQRGVTQFNIDYSNLESVRGGDVLYTPWELNGNYRVNPITQPSDTEDNFTLRWTSVKFDSIVDTDNDVSYNKFSFNSLTVDSIFFFFTHTNTSGTNDTLILTMFEASSTPSGLTFAAGGGNVNNTNIVATNNVLWTDTIITDQSLSSNTPFDGASIEVLDPLGNPVVVPQGKGFVVRIDYFGPKEDLFEVIDFNRYDCGAPPDEYASDAYVTNTTRWFNLYLSAQQDFRGTGALFLQATAGCDNYFFQNMGIGAVVSVDAPLTARATASETVACPGAFVTLNSGASGGSGDFSYTWSGNGNFTSPNSTSTSVSLPSGNGPETYTVTVVDNIENTTVTSSVNVTVRGVVVNLGNDTTLSCGDSLLVAAATTGFLNGSQFLWSASANNATTQSVFVKGGATYSVTVTNNAGCTATDSKVVGLDVNQTVSFTASTFYNGSATPGLLSQNRACQSASILFDNTSTDVSSAWSFEWNYGDQSGSVNVDGTKTYSTTGVYTVTLTASDASGCVITSAPLQIQVLPTNHPLCVINSIEEVKLLSNISLFPNPNNGSFTVDMSQVTATDASIMVVDLMGKVVANTNTFSTTANPIQTIDLNTAANGIYFVRITANGVTATSKITVAK